MTPPEIRSIPPQDIEAASFAIIEEELGPHGFTPDQFALVRRVIHATGDFAHARTLRFHPRAVEAGIAAIRQGRNLLVDVNMAAAGISRSLLERFGGRILCLVGEEETARLARERGLTRSEAAMERAAAMDVGLVAVGNAPTALLAAMRLKEDAASPFDPALVVGVPVGFVNAAESKEILAGKPYPFITSLGRKGGTPAAVALVNALLRLAVDREGT